MFQNRQPGRVAVVIVNYRTAELALDCVAALARERDCLPDLKVIVVDGGSGDGSADRLREGLAAPHFVGWTQLLPLEVNGGFGWANNQAMLRLLQSEDRPDFIHLLNPDARIEPGAVVALRDFMIDHPHCAVAGSQLVNPDRSASGSAFRFPTILREFVAGTRTHRIGTLLGVKPTLIQSDGPEQADWVTGASCMMSTDALLQTGLFDHGFFLYFEEVELMFRLKSAGWDIFHVPDSQVMHIGGAATGVRQGKSVAAPTKPDYWYQSRRRFHALSYGRVRTALAGLAWLGGDLFWKLRTMLQPALCDETDAAERKSFRCNGIWARADDMQPHVAMAGDPLDQPPAWITRV